MPTRRPACGADRGVLEHNEAAALALRPSVDSTIQRDAARPPSKRRGTLGSVSLPGNTEAERNHVVCGVDYASLMLVDVVAIPPSGSPFFKFVQGNPVCSTNSRDTFTARSFPPISAVQAVAGCATQMAGGLCIALEPAGFAKKSLLIEARS